VRVEGRRRSHHALCCGKRGWRWLGLGFG
jgi:hypothetical protein